MPVTGDALLVFRFWFSIFDGVAGLDLEGDGLAQQSLHKDLHLGVCGITWLPPATHSTTSLKDWLILRQSIVPKGEKNQLSS